MKPKTEPSFFSAQIDMDKFDWTREKAEKISIRASAAEYELVGLETPEEKQLAELMRIFFIDCLLTPRERYRERESLRL